MDSQITIMAYLKLLNKNKIISCPVPLSSFSVVQSVCLEANVHVFVKQYEYIYI